MLREKFYPKVVSILNSWADALNRRGITPNQVTSAGVALSFLAGFCFSNSALLVGAIFMALGGVCDAVDGPLARLSGKESKFGAFYDSIMDRFADGFLFGGIALHYFNQDEPFWTAVCIGLIIAAFGVSYAKARAENFIEKCSVGVFTRETRWAAVGVGVLFPFLLKPLLLISFGGSVWTVYQRVMHTKNTLERPASAEVDAAI